MLHLESNRQKSEKLYKTYMNEVSTKEFRRPTNEADWEKLNKDQLLQQICKS